MPPILKRFTFYWIVSASCAGPCLCAEEVVSRNYPGDWSVFEPMLMPIGEAVKLKEVPLPDDTEIETETLTSRVHVVVRKDGSSVMMTQDIRKLIRESAKEAFSTRRLSFAPSRSKIHVITARTILPDETSVDVEDSGLFIEQPKNDNDLLFTDRKQIRVVFPKVSPGSIIELVVVKEEEGIIPNHWSFSMLWQSLEPIRARSLTVDVPESLADQLICDDVKSGSVREEVKAPAGMRRFVWKRESIPPIVVQGFLPDPYQRGPYTRVALAGNWDLFGKWFSGLVRAASADTSSELGELAKKWAGKAQKPRQIAESLYEKVSRDIRYTGLEFGKGAFQPRSPSSVIETRYGDCKDKSNLLRLLLDHHGIESRMVLIKTSWPGEVSRKIASVGLFDHAILAVYFDKDKDPVYCDATLDGAPFGMISQRDEGKDALIIDAQGGLTWGKTPPRIPVNVELNCDFDIIPLGIFAGWLDLKMSGSRGWLRRRHFESLETRSARCQFAVENYFQFIPGLRLVDCEPVDSGSKFPFHYRFYGIQEKGNIDPTAKTVRFGMPAPSSIVTPVGPAGKRIHPFLFPAMIVNASVTAKLPEGWDVLDHRPAYEDKGKGFAFSSVWTPSEGAELVGKVSMTRDQFEFSPRAFERMAEAAREHMAWVSSPVLLRRPVAGSEDADDDPESWEPDPEALPKMPSGEGFDILIKEWFPLDLENVYVGNHEARRKAYQRMARIYPKSDHDTQFIARVMAQMSRLLQFTTTKQANSIAEKLKKTIGQYENKLPPGKIAGAEILVATALVEAGEREVPTEICKAMMERSDVPKQVKFGAAGLLCLLIAEEEPKRCNDLADFALRSPILPSQNALNIASVKLDCVARLPGATAETIFKAYRALMDNYPDFEEDLPDTFVYGPRQLVDFGHHESALLFRDAIDLAIKDGDDLEEELEDLDEYFEQIEKVEPLREKLSQFLDRNPWPNLYIEEKGNRITCASDCVDLYEDSKEVTARYLLRGMIAYGAQYDFADRISEFVENYRSWKEAADKPKTPAFPETIESTVDRLIGLWQECPEGDYVDKSDANSAMGERLYETKGSAAAVKFYRSVLDDEEADSYTRMYSLQGIWETYDEEKDLLKFVDSLRLVEPFLDEREWRDEAVMLGAYLNLVLQRPGEARRLFQLAVDDQKESEDSDYPAGSIDLAKQVLQDLDSYSNRVRETEARQELTDEILKALKVSNDLWENYQLVRPWSQVSQKEIKKLGSMKSARKRKRLTKAYLGKQLLFSRFHPSGEKAAIALLKIAANDFPKQKDLIDRLLEDFGDKEEAANEVE